MGARATAACSHARNKTFIFLWTSKQFQQEQVEWNNLNKILQNQGFKPVYFADPIENKNLSDLVLLGKESCGELRETLRTMLNDCERKLIMIEELVQSNNQLKEQVQQRKDHAAQQRLKVANLQVILDQVKTQAQELEDRFLSKTMENHIHIQQLQQDKEETQRRCGALEQKLQEQKLEAAQLYGKLQFTVREEENRRVRLARTFQKVCKRVARQSPADQQILDVMDFYERKLNRVLEKLRSGSFRGRVKKTVLKDQQRRSKSDEVREVEESQDQENQENQKVQKDQVLQQELEPRSPEYARKQSPETKSHSHGDYTPQPAAIKTSLQNLQEVLDRGDHNPHPAATKRSLQNLQEVLDRACRAPAAEGVNQPLSRSELQLEDEDLHSIILKLKQHHEFFPRFYTLTNDILKILGVNRLDDIIPSLKRLTQTSH